MKLLFIVFSFLLITSCQKEKPSTLIPNFLVGDWIRVNEEEGNTTYESWNTNLKGLGYTLKENDTIFKEKLSFIMVKDTLFLKVEGVNDTATLFKLTQQTDSSFVCENPINEFPKTIKYYLENEQLKAIVSANNFKIEFIFDKL